MRCVYILRRLPHSSERYVGITHDLAQRLEAHNSGKCPHTSKFAPWKVSVATYIEDDDRAAAFERYLKSRSGRAFAMRHFR